MNGNELAAWPEPEPAALAELVRRAELAAELLLAEHDARQAAALEELAATQDNELPPGPRAGS